MLITRRFCLFGVCFGGKGVAVCLFKKRETRLHFYTVTSMSGFGLESRNYRNSATFVSRTPTLPSNGSFCEITQNEFFFVEF